MSTPDKTTQAPSLQTPGFIYANGAVRPWADATLHVTVEGVQRGMNVFEGLKGFWQPDGRFGLLAMPRHYARLKRSAALMHMPFDMTFDAYDAACHEITACQRDPGRNMWLRTTLYIVEGHWGHGDRTDLVCAAYHHPKGPAPRMATGVTTWRRATDNAMPARIKTGFNYLAARFAKIEGRSRGYPEMVLLNEAGRVAEFIGSGLIMVRDGVIYAPPASEGAFESITVDIIRALCTDMGIEFRMRPIDRTELIIADEIAAVGTLNDMVLISSFDGREMGPSPVLDSVLTRYLDACEGREPHPAVDLTFRRSCSWVGRRRTDGSPTAFGREIYAVDMPLPDRDQGVTSTVSGMSTRFMGEQKTQGNARSIQTPDPDRALWFFEGLWPKQNRPRPSCLSSPRGTAVQ